MKKPHMITLADIDDIFETVIASDSREQKRLTICVNPTDDNPILYRVKIGKLENQTQDIKQAIRAYNGEIAAKDVIIVGCVNDPRMRVNCLMQAVR